MRCADCGLYECALRSPLGGCPNGEAVEQTVIITAPDSKPYNLGNGPWDKGYEPSGIYPTDFDGIKLAASDLVDAVERYTKPEKGQFCHRSELLNVKNKLKELLKDE